MNILAVVVGFLVLSLSFAGKFHFLSLFYLEPVTIIMLNQKEISGNWGKFIAFL